MPNIHDIVGCLVISAWTNVCLYGVESWAAALYFAKYKNDDLWIKLLVAAAWLNDAVATVVNCRSVYHFTITGFGDVKGLTNPGPGLIVVATSLGFSVSFTQIYLIRRYFAISKNKYVSAFLALAALSALCFNWYCLTKISAIKSLADYQSLDVYVKAFVGLEAGTDLLISVALVCVLARHYRDSSISNTRSLLLRLMWLSIESGLVTTAVAISVLLTFILAPNTNAGLATSDNMGRVYTLTLLYNLHIRKSRSDKTESCKHVSSHSFPLNSLGKKTEDRNSQSRDAQDQSIPVSLEAGRDPSFPKANEKGAEV